MAKRTIMVQRDVEDVFDLLADASNLLDAAWGGGWEVDSTDRIGLGSTFGAKKRMIGPFLLILSFVVTDYHRPTRLAFRVSMPPYRSPVKLFIGRKRLPDSEDIWELERVAEGTKITRTFSMRGTWAPSLGLRQDLENVRRALEAAN